MDIWTVGGKVDGIAIDKDGNKTILEIKNRVNRLFNTVRDTYMKNYFCNYHQIKQIYHQIYTKY